MATNTTTLSVVSRMEPVETKKDFPKEASDTTPILENEMPKTAALCCLTSSMWGPKRVCLLCSGFSYKSTLPEIENEGFHCTIVFKQKDANWLKGPDAKNN